MVPQRFQRHPRLELPRESRSRAHCVSLPSSLEYTLATCPIFRDHLMQQLLPGWVRLVTLDYSIGIVVC